MLLAHGTLDEFSHSLGPTQTLPASAWSYSWAEGIRLMSCLGVFYALSAEHSARLLALRSDAKRLAFLDDISRPANRRSKVGFSGWLFRIWAGRARLQDDEPFAVDVDKAWDAIHCCLERSPANAPERMAVFGGVRLMNGRTGMVIEYKTPEHVKSISTALAAITRDELLSRYSALDEGDYDFPDSVTREEDAEYTCENFDFMRQFYERAAADERAAIFTVDSTLPP